MAGNSILVINAAGAETRVALIESGTIHEYYLERKREKGIVGNIYKGRVVRVLPGMQAAFVDIGLEKAAFLYVGDVYGDPDFSEEFELTEGEHSERVPEVPTEQEAEEQEVKALARRGPAAEPPRPSRAPPRPPAGRTSRAGARRRRPGDPPGPTSPRWSPPTCPVRPTCRRPSSWPSPRSTRAPAPCTGPGGRRDGRARHPHPPHPGGRGG